MYKAFSREQVSSSIKSVFPSDVADLGWPEPAFLFMVPLSLKCFENLFTDVKVQCFNEWFFQILYADHPFSS